MIRGTLTGTIIYNLGTHIGILILYERRHLDELQLDLNSVHVPQRGGLEPGLRMK